MTPALVEREGLEIAGLNVAVGGKQGSGGPRFATPLDAFVMPDEAADVCAAIALIFRDHGPREARSKSRLAFLVDEWGAARSARSSRRGSAACCRRPGATREARR
jgi:ferredoxin-nitrite reductase